MSSAIDYSKPIIVVDQIARTSWPVKYAGPHPTTRGWHRLVSDGAVKDVDADGYVQGALAMLKVQNGDG